MRFNVTCLEDRLFCVSETSVSSSVLLSFSPAVFGSSYMEPLETPYVEALSLPCIHFYCPRALLMWQLETGEEKHSMIVYFFPSWWARVPAL